MRRRRLSVAMMLAIAVVGSVQGAAVASAAQLEVMRPAGSTMPSSCGARPCMPSPGLSAPGVDVACVPTNERPTPIILLHGTRSDKTINWQYLGPELATAGFCVYSLNMPDRGQSPIAESVAALANRVEEVLQETGARRVSLFGHSLGGTVARDYVTRGGGLHVVDDLIAMGTPHFGFYTEPPGDEVDKAFNTECPSCWEQAQGSEYLQGLNARDITPGSISYTSIITAQDGVALPLAHQYFPENGRVANILLQDACPDHVVDHLTMALDPLVRDWVVDALDRHGPADVNREDVDCAPAP